MPIPDTARIELADALQLHADITQTLCTNYVTTWTSSDPSVVNIDASGFARAVAYGAPVTLRVRVVNVDAANVTVERTTTATAIVVPPTIATVTVDPPTTTLLVGQRRRLTASGRSRTGVIVTPTAVSWGSTAPTVAAVDDSGFVTAVAPGSASIRVVADSKLGVADVLVTDIPVASVSVTPSAASVPQGATIALAAVAKDAVGATLTGRTITWSSAAPTIATVSATGVVTGVAPGGPVLITATSEGRAGTAAITVTSSAVASVGVTPAVASVVRGTSVPLTATLRDATGAVITNEPVGWTTSNAAVATVSTSGVVTGVATGGPVTVTATAGGRSGSAAVTVVPPAVATVTVAPTDGQISVGATRMFSATARDALGTVLTDETVLWSSSVPAIASVSTSGLVTALAEGTATVTATVRGVSGTVPIRTTATRLAYVMATEPSLASYTPAAGTQYNSLGAPITIARTGTGRYVVAIPSFGSADARVPFVSAVSTTNVTCYTPNWSLSASDSGTVRVECKDGSGDLVDAPFALLALGANGLPGRLGFGSTLGMSSFPGAAQHAWTSGTAVTVERFNFSPVGRFEMRFGFPAIGAPTSAFLVAQVTDASPRCVVPAAGSLSVNVMCFVGSAPADAAFNAVLMDRGRTGFRLGFGDNGSTAVGAPAAPSTVTLNSAGGSVTTTRQAEGVYRTTFVGLGRPAGGSEVVMLTSRILENGSRCVHAPWQTVGSALVVDVRCFSPTGSPVDMSYSLLIIE
ncbi:MAG: Ig-like domain-containing protein [Gemmatimonadaceae bacterium]|nr:Ig-like domain-containing protein [Gemmatimonadaceae bacterium]